MQKVNYYGSSPRAFSKKLLTFLLFLGFGISAFAQCDWTVEVTSTSSPGDEITWQLKDANGNILLEGLPDEAMGTFTTIAEGPLSFHIETYGNWNDNDALYSVSNELEIVAQGHIQGAEEADHENLFCAILDDCDEVTAGTVEDLEACANTPITLTATGVSQGQTGIIYQWERSTDLENWTTINQANTPTYTLNIGISQETYFRLVVSCENGNTDTSDVITATLKPILECYCVPQYFNGCSSNQRISNVTLNGETQNINNDSECSDNAYGDYTDLPPADLVAGQNYQISVSTSYAFPANFEYKAWIDYDQSGSFEDGETIAYTNMNGMPTGTETIDFDLPEDLEPGTYRLRVRLVYGNMENITACGTFDSGETEDYFIEVVELDDCTEPVSAGEVANGSLNICPNTSFSLTVEGASNPANGLTRIWQQSPAGQDDWTDMEGEKFTVLNVEDGIYQDTNFRFAVTCDAGETQYTNTVEVVLNEIEDCYCTPENTTQSGSYITNIKTDGGIIDLNKTSGFSENGYANYTETDILKVTAGQEVEFKTSFNGNASYVKVWVDWNKDGIFSEDEEVIATVYYENSPYTGTFTIPEGIDSDFMTRIRVRIKNAGGSPDACSDSENGETEDYGLQIIDAPDCLPPADIDVVNITANAALITWAPGGEEESWEVIYGETGFDLENAEAWTVEDYTQLQLNDLESETEYEFYLRSICSDGESLLYGPSYFTTECSATEVPYLENFDDVVLPNIPDCTSLETNSGNPWKTQSGNLQGYEGNVLYYQYHFTENADSWFFTRGIQLEAGVNYRLSYRYGNNSDFYIERLKVAMGYAPSSAAMQEEFADHEISLNGSETNEVDFTVEEDGIFYFGFQAHSTANQITLFLDDISVDFGPTCPKPTSVDFQYVSDQSARVLWNAGANDTEWEVIYGLEGFDPETEGESLTVDTPYADLNNLEEDTTYDVYVKAICDTESSELTSGHSFTTLTNVPENARLCDAIMLGANIACDVAEYTNINSFEEIDEPSGSCHNTFMGTTSVWFSFVAGPDGEATIIATPSFSQLMIELAAFEAPEDCSDLSELVEVGCATVNNDLNLTGLIPGETYYIRVAGFNDSEGEFCIEVQMEEAPEVCEDPSDIIVTDVEDTVATVEWTANGDETQWEVTHGITGFDLETEGQSEIVNTNSILLSFLEPETEYDVYVRAICSDDLTSDWVGPETFTTEPMSVTGENFNGFNFYPNPVQEVLTLKATAQIEKVEVFNLLGQSVMIFTPNDMETQLHTDQLQSGAYLMKVSIEGATKTFRVIKK